MYVIRDLIKIGNELNRWFVKVLIILCHLLSLTTIISFYKTTLTLWERFFDDYTALWNKYNKLPILSPVVIAQLFTPAFYIYINTLTSMLASLSYWTTSLVPRPLPLLHKLGEGLVCDVTRFTSHLMNVGGVNHNPLFKSCSPRLTSRPRTLC